jgi:hypothetical protein
VVLAGTACLSLETLAFDFLALVFSGWSSSKAMLSNSSLSILRGILSFLVAGAFEVALVFSFCFISSVAFSGEASCFITSFCYSTLA